MLALKHNLKTQQFCKTAVHHNFVLTGTPAFCLKIAVRHLGKNMLTGRSPIQGLWHFPWPTGIMPGKSHERWSAMAWCSSIRTYSNRAINCPMKCYLFKKKKEQKANSAFHCSKRRRLTRSTTRRRSTTGRRLDRSARPGEPPCWPVYRTTTRSNRTKVRHKTVKFNFIIIDAVSSSSSAPDGLLLWLWMLRVVVACFEWLNL